MEIALIVLMLAVILALAVLRCPDWQEFTARWLLAHARAQRNARREFAAVMMAWREAEKQR